MDERQPSIIAIIYYNSLLLINLLTTSFPRTKKTKVLLLPLNLFIRRNLGNLDISIVYQLFQRTKDEVGNLLRGKVGFDERRRRGKEKEKPPRIQRKVAAGYCDTRNILERAWQKLRVQLHN